MVASVECRREWCNMLVSACISDESSTAAAFITAYKRCKLLAATPYKMVLHYSS